jgi:hypothetical protein
MGAAIFRRRRSSRRSAPTGQHQAGLEREPNLYLSRDRCRVGSVEEIDAQLDLPASTQPDIAGD